VAIVCRQLLNTGYPGMGVGRYIRLPDKPDTAEIAITILDCYQNKGIGTLLYCLLADNALKNGIRHLAGYIQADNAPMSALLQKFGFTVKSRGQNLLYWENDIMNNEAEVRQLLAGHLVFKK
jgi:L-amino acid N-acyltransferase YncA